MMFFLCNKTTFLCLLCLSHKHEIFYDTYIKLLIGAVYYLLYIFLTNKSARDF
jgi:hypothetical protein